jgi:hypothetical protein
MSRRKLIVGVGNKARQGKDVFASNLQETIPEKVGIVHWADALKKEVANEERKFPLIYQNTVNGKTFYLLLNSPNGMTYYEVREASLVPNLHKIFETRKITSYMGMDEKDPLMLQFWGTDYRRAQADGYWVTKTMRTIDTMPEEIILIPDTRFRNEYKAIKDRSGKYIKVIRTNEDGTVYIDPSRDGSHQSEIDLDEAYPDYTIKCMSGDLTELKLQSLSIGVKLLTTHSGMSYN